MNILEFPKESNPKAFNYVHLVHEDETKFITNPKYKEQYENMKNLPIDSALRVHYSKLDAKGQLISECLFDILNFPKNQRKI